MSSALCIYPTSPDPEKGFKRTVFLRRKFNLRANLLNFSIRIDHLHQSRISSNFLACLWASINIFSAKLDNFIPGVMIWSKHHSQTCSYIFYAKFLRVNSGSLSLKDTLENVFFFLYVFVFFVFLFVFWAVYEKFFPFLADTPWDFEKWSDKVACC